MLQVSCRARVRSPCAANGTAVTVTRCGALPARPPTFRIADEVDVREDDDGAGERLGYSPPAQPLLAKTVDDGHEGEKDGKREGDHPPVVEASGRLIARLRRAHYRPWRRLRAWRRRLLPIFRRPRCFFG